MLKNFQLHFTPMALQAESDAWRAVIHLNLVRSVNFIIDLLSDAIAAQGSAYASSYNPHPHSHQHGGSHAQSHGNAHGGGGDTSPTANSFAHHRLSATATPHPASEIRRYKLALSPLRQVEMILSKRLSVHDVPSRLATPAESSSSWLSGRSDVAVRGGRGWKSLLKRRNQSDSEGSVYSAEQLENARQILDACKADIVALWASESVQAGLRDEGIALQEQSGLYVVHTYAMFFVHCVC